MRKQKIVDGRNGKITVTKSVEERYPYSSEILMNHGFGIIFLNMALGLLPITIWGTRMKYFKCSISQFYTTLFCICFIVLSVIFVPIVFFPKEGERTMTNLVLLIAMGMVHTLGYILLLIRGHFVARNIPVVWSSLSKLLQIAVVNVYGSGCHLLQEASSFARWAVAEYLFIMVTTMGSTLAFSTDYQTGITHSVKYYKLDLYVFRPEELGGDMSAFQRFQWFTFNVGYFIWQLCSSSHLLVSMFLCYMVIVITVCIKSANQQITELQERYSPRDNKISTFHYPRIRFLGDRRDSTEFVGPTELEEVVDKLEGIKLVGLIAAEITQTMSLTWGVSLIVEALILIAAGTVNTFNFLAMFDEKQNEDNGGVMKFSLPDVDEWINIFVTVSNHFFFLFKLTSRVTKMIEESNKSLHLLKLINLHHLPKPIRDKVQALKQDLASTPINLTATNFFQVNRFLITSITSQIATYVIVLLQFAQQEITKGSGGGGASNDSSRDDNIATRNN